MAFYNKQNYHCVVAAIELEKYDIGHEMSNQESRHRKRHLSWITTLKLTTGVYLHAASHFGTAPDLFRILLDHCSCPSVLILAQLYAQMCPKHQHSLEEHCWHHAIATSTVAPLRFGKARMALSDKQNYRCMASNLRSMPLDMKCQINNQGSRQGIFLLPTESWVALENWQQVVTYNFAASLLCSAPPLFRILLDHGSCPIVLILAQPPWL